MYLVLIVS